MRKNNIILIGMPASGKSTVGVVLAKVLRLDFIDTDLLIQKQEGCRLETIIREKGTEAFLSIEEGVCSSLAVQDCVVATGGSVVYSDSSMRHLKDLGTVVYLQADLKTLKTRLSDVAKRGVVLRKDQSVEDLYEERIVLYEKYADITVAEKDMTLEETVMALADILGV